MKGSVMNHKIGISLLLLAAVCFVNGCKEKEISQIEEVKVAETTKVEKAKAQTAKMVKLQTSMGDIVIELDQNAAPVTVKNFLDYVQSDFYSGTIFHRVINGFMIQGGGFEANMRQKGTKPPIVNEASNGLKNDRGTISMARTNNPNSATSQFFINLVNNAPLNYSSRNPGYAVFGKVVEGLEVVDAIAKVKTTTKSGMRDVPAEVVEIKSAEILD
jgi:cyclophilin family peptidyl-prolyl cis-trans isomerase